MNTWPITVVAREAWTYVGVPDRLGTGQAWRIDETFPTLEQVAGDGWSDAILREILPPDRAWAWWSRTDAYKSTQLPTDPAPDVFDPGALARVVTRRLRLEGRTLVFVPARDLASQQTVTGWAGGDTEQAPDHIWTAPGDRPWRTDEIVAWCRDPGQWSDATTVPIQPAERIVTLFDQQIFCALPANAAAPVITRLGELAARWKLSVISGPSDHAWPVRPRR